LLANRPNTEVAGKSCSHQIDSAASRIARRDQCAQDGPLSLRERVRVRGSQGAKRFLVDLQSLGELQGLKVLRNSATTSCA